MRHKHMWCYFRVGEVRRYPFSENFVEQVTAAVRGSNVLIESDFRMVGSVNFVQGLAS
jgi:hypothetical protein